MTMRYDWGKDYPPPLTAAQVEEMVAEATERARVQVEDRSQPLGMINPGVDYSRCKFCHPESEHSGTLRYIRWRSASCSTWAGPTCWCEGSISYYASAVEGFEWRDVPLGECVDCGKETSLYWYSSAPRERRCYDCSQKHQSQHPKGEARASASPSIYDAKFSAPKRVMARCPHCNLSLSANVGSTASCPCGCWFAVSSDAVVGVSDVTTDLATQKPHDKPFICRCGRSHHHDVRCVQIMNPKCHDAKWSAAMWLCADERQGMMMNDGLMWRDYGDENLIDKVSEGPALIWRRQAALPPSESVSAKPAVECCNEPGCGKTASRACTNCGVGRCDDHITDPSGVGWVCHRREGDLGQRFTCIGHDKPSYYEKDVVPPRKNSLDFVIYCENAPPREVVEGTIVMLDGDECGGVPKVPYLKTHLCWTSHMKWEWERHEAHQKRWHTRAMEAADRNDKEECLVADKRYAARVDYDVTPPSTRDMYGGLVMCVAGDEPHPLMKRHGYRCALCGGWLRRVDRP